MIVGLACVSIPVRYFACHFLVSFKKTKLGSFLAFGPAKQGLAGLWLGLAAGAFTTSIILTVVLWRVDWQKVVEEAQQELK